MRFDLYYILPELILTAGALIALAIGLAARKQPEGRRTGIFSLESFSLLVIIGALIPAVIMLTREDILGGVVQFFQEDNILMGMLAIDGLAIFFKVIALVSTAIVILLSMDFFKGVFFHRGEYYALLIFAVLAICLVAASTDMIMIYLSLELLGITSYILTAYLKRDPKSNEAGVKYFLYGAVCSAVMLYGMSMLYGLTGTTNILAMREILQPLSSESQGYHLIFLSFVMILVGFGFKIAMIPFHQWAPDAYEGAPTPITAFLSVASKAAGFAVLIRVLSSSITISVIDWMPLIIILSGLTMTVGNLIAIAQHNIKRMLAYSSIAQSGYLLLGIAAMPYSDIALSAILMYLLIYLFMNLGAFSVITILSARLNSDDIRDYAGLYRRAPIAAVAMVIFLLSLAGIPPTAGFMAKFYLFMAAIQTGDPDIFWLTVVALVNVIISLYYYMNVVRQMFFTKAKSAMTFKVSSPLYLAIGLTLSMTFLGLFYAKPFIELARLSARIFGI